ncbi:MAG: hypothetical protein GX864_04010 [Mollicutes bacterium]|nr:hypothetical protein [Mollicutes bacterium]
MSKKLMKKVIGVLLAVVMLASNVGNAFAEIYISEGSVQDKKLRLHGTMDDDPNDFSEGYVEMKVISVVNNVIQVSVSVHTTTVGIEEAHGDLTLTPNIIENFLITTEGDGVIQDSDNPQKINWAVGALGPDQSQEFIYTLTPNETFSDVILSDRFFVADTFIFTHGPGQGTQEVIFNQYIGETICIPYVKITEKEEENKDMGLFTDIIILSAIAVAAGGVLVITLKNNKFTNI